MSTKSLQRIQTFRDRSNLNKILLVASALVLAISLIALAALLNFKGSLDEVVEVHGRHIELISQLRAEALKRTTILGEIVTLTDPFLIDQRITEHNEAATVFLVARRDLSGIRLTDDEKAMIERIDGYAAILYEQQEAIKSMVIGGKSQHAARVLAEEVIPAQRIMLDLMDKFRDYNRAEINEQTKAVGARARILGWVIGLTGLLAWASLFLVKRRALRTQDRLLDDLSDISAERENLLRSLQYQKLALDEHAIVSVTDPAGNIFYANKKFCEVSGYSEDELLGHPHRIINSGYHPPEFWRDLWQTISGGKVWNGVVRNRRKDGEPYWVATTIVPFLDKQGIPYQYVGIRTDITRLKKIEAQLARANTELTLAARDAIEARELSERANRAKSEFLSIMSHEFRTPINAVMGFSEIMLAEHPEPDWEYAQEAHLIHGAGKSLLEMVDKIFGYIELEDADWTGGSETCYLSELMDDVVEAFEAKAKAKGLQFKHDAAICPGQIAADPSRIFDVLKILVGNAIEITEMGEVSVTCGPVTQEIAGEAKPFWRIGVRDTGPGVPPGFEESVFEAFRQGADSLTRVHQGIGLGLAIAKRVVEAYGGRIWCEQAPGGGALFQFVLPAKTDPTT